MNDNNERGHFYLNLGWKTEEAANLIGLYEDGERLEEAIEAIDIALATALQRIETLKAILKVAA